MVVGICVTVARMSLEYATTKKVALNMLQAPLALPLALMVAAIALSGLVAGGIGEAFKSVFMLRTIVVYFWAYQIFATKPHLIFRSIEWLLATGAAAGLFGAIQQLFHFHPFTYPYLQGTGFQSGPMEFAGQMEVLSMIALALFLKKGKGAFSAWFLKVPIFQVIVLCNILGVIFASERSAWLGVILASICVSLIVSWRASLAVVTALIVAGSVAWFTVPVFQKRLTPLADPNQDIGARVRFQVWDEAMKQFQKSPATGIGFRKFPQLDIPEAIVPGRSKYLDHAHSNYLHILSTTGVVGLLCFLWLQWSMVLTAWRRYAGHGDEAAIALGILGAVVSLMVAGIFEYNFKTGQVRLTLWYVLAMLVSSKAYLHPALGVEAPGSQQPHDSD